MTDLDAVDGDVDEEDLSAAAAAVDAAAHDLEVSRDEAIERLVVALAAANGVAIEAPDADGLDAIETRIETLDETAERLEATVDELETTVDEATAERSALEADLDEKIEDLRDRVVRLYRDVETKAPSDHAHSDIEDEIADMDATIANTADRTSDLSTTVENLSTTVEGLSTTVEGLSTRHEDLSEKLSKVANAVVRTQRRLEPIERHVAEERRLAELTAEANRYGVRKADCEECGNTVLLSLLSTPECPHCEDRLRALEPNTGFFGRSTLLVGDPPALEGDVSARGAGDLVGDGEGTNQ